MERLGEHTEDMAGPPSPRRPSDQVNAEHQQDHPSAILWATGNEQKAAFCSPEPKIKGGLTYILMANKQKDRPTSLVISSVQSRSCVRLFVPP